MFLNNSYFILINSLHLSNNIGSISIEMSIEHRSNQFISDVIKETDPHKNKRMFLFLSVIVGCMWKFGFQ